jgi:hypothetical protein
VRTTEDNRKVIAEVFQVPLEEVLHYTIIMEGRQGIGTSFCGLSRDALNLLGRGVMVVSAQGDAMDVTVMANGGTSCGWPREER